MLKNSYSTRNLGIPSSIILNNYSIQNLIINPKEIDPYYDISIGPEDNYIKKQNILSHSPSAQKLPLKSYNSFNFKPINLFDKNSILLTNPSVNNINEFRISEFSDTTKNKNKTIIIPIKKLIFDKKNQIESHPKDSVSRNKLKKENNNSIYKKYINNKFLFKKTNKILRKPMSQSYSNYFKNVLINDKYKKNEKKEIHQKNSLFKQKKVELNNTKILYIQPKILNNLREFLFREEIGKGTFGKIFSVIWKKNNKYYAMKKEILNDYEEVKKRKYNCQIIQNFIKKTGNNGVINLYGNICFKNKNKIDIITNNNNNDIQKIKVNEYVFYELMEKAERDWNKEINIRSQYNLYYKEKELINIIKQLVLTLSLLQKFHITHRDIKPQNILVLNGQYKLCDFGEIRVLQRDGLIVQRVRGSELYMSPILFQGLHNNFIQVRHNTYKSDVFSLGMCLFYAASLTYSGVDSIRELNDMNEIKKIIFDYLGNRYSEKLIFLILDMLEIDENKRQSFIQLEGKVMNL